MPTFEVGPGRDYTSLSAWESDRQGDLVAAGDGETALCFDFEDTIQLNIAGWTSDASNFITIIADGDHGGVWNTSVYRLKTSVLSFFGNNSGGFVYMQVIGIQVETTAAASSCIRLDANDPTERFILFSKVITRSTNGSPTGSPGFYSQVGTSVIWENCLAFDTFHGFGNGDTDANSQIRWLNCGAHNNLGKGFDVQSNTPHKLAINCWAQSSVGPNFDNHGFNAPGTRNNASEDGTAPGGAPKTGAIVFVDEPNDDFHIDPSDLVARISGLDLSQFPDHSFDDDIDGDSRVGLVWDIGPDQIPNVLPPVITHVIDPDGSGDYSSLSSWEAAQARDLVAANELAAADCAASTGVLADTATCTLSGWTTDQVRSILIKSDQLHNGIYDDTIYRMEPDNTTGILQDFAGGAEHLEIRNIQIKPIITFSQTAAGIHLNASHTNTNGRFRRIINCLITLDLVGTSIETVGIKVGRGSSSSLGTDPTIIRNCIIYGFRRDATEVHRGIGLITNNPVTYVYNCTITDCHTGFFSQQALTPLFVKNTVCDGNDNNWSGAAGDYNAASTNNASDTETPPGSNPETGTTTFVNRAGGDFHLDAADTVCIDNAVDLSTDLVEAFIDDIDGDIRVDPWDIGADEISQGETATLQAASATATAQDAAAIVSGVVTAGLDAASPTANAFDAVLVLAEIIATLQAAGATTTAQDVAAVLATRTVPLDGATATANAQNVFVFKEATLEAASATSTASDVVVETIGAQTANLDAASVTASAKDVAAVLALITSVLEEASAASDAKDVTAGTPVTVATLGFASVVATAQDVLAGSGVVVATLQPVALVALAKNVIVPGLVQVEFTLPFNEEAVAETVPFEEDNQRIDLGGHEE